ncbi:MAG: hypothetical protein ORN98_01810 [Alphaproteobacteria bacterium]|nr:hypothetical protein [Alphaproteobacteria bacterium]
MTPTVTPSKFHPKDVVLLFGLAVAARLVIGYAFPGMVFFDEIYQILEPAHFRAFGTGLLPWEYYLGIRSWLLPMIFAPMMQFAAVFSTNPDLVLLPIKIFLAGLGAVTAIIAYGFGLRYYNRRVAVLIGVMMALWSEQIYFATHPLTEIIATPILLWVLYLSDGVLKAAKSAPTPNFRRYFSIGLLMGLVFVLRFHLAPALAVVAIWLISAGERATLWTRALAIFCGGIMVGTAAAGFDWLTLGTPLQSVWLNAVVNLQDGVSSGFGTSPPWDVFDLIWRYWLVMTPIMAGLIWLAWRRSPLLLVAGLMILLTHTIIAHKEPRFIYPAMTIFTLLAAMGLNEAYQRLAPRFSYKLGENRPVFAILGIWCVLSLSVSLLVNFSGPNSLWFNGRVFNRVFARISTEGIAPCGLALDRAITFFMTPGQSGLPPTTRLYTPVSDELLRQHVAAYDGILSRLSDEFAQYGYQRKFCLATHLTRDRLLKAFPPPDPICYYQRPGACDAAQGLVHEDGLIAVIRPERWRYGQRDLMLKLGLTLPPELAEAPPVAAP